MSVDKDEGRPCLACNKCDGFSLHVWRKRCRNCFCKREEHDTVSGDEAASDAEQDAGGERTMDFNSGARRGPQSNDSAQGVARTGKKWSRPAPEVTSKPQRPSGSGKKWTPPASESAGYDADGSSGGGSGSARRWGVSASTAGDSGSGAGAGSVGVSTSLSGSGGVGSGGGGSGSGAYDGTGSLGDLPPPPPPPAGGGLDGGDRHVSFQLDRNTEHSVPSTPSDPLMSASVGAGGAGAGAGGASAGAGGQGSGDFDLDIDFDVDQILANAGLDVPGKEAAPGSAASAGAGASSAGSSGGAGGGAGGFGAGAGSGGAGAGAGQGTTVTVGGVDVDIGLGAGASAGAGAGAGASGSPGVEGDLDFPELDFGDLPAPADFDDLPPPPEGGADASSSGSISVSVGGSAAGAGGKADAGAAAGGGRAAGEMPSTVLVVSSYTWTPPGLTKEQSNQFMSDIPLEYRPFDTSDGRQKSNKWQQEQNPPHDADPAACNSPSQEETDELKEFVQLREQQNHGFGKVTASSSQASCARCSQRFAPSAVVVEADRLPRKAWHPHCFTCKTCNQFLSQLEYYANESDLYCGRHHAELTKPRCGGCDELILVGSFTKAQDKTWHAQHFCCFRCDRPLAADSAKEEYARYKDQVVCLKCYGDHYAKRCDSCRQLIPAGAEQLTHGDRQWHIECFSCSGCQAKLDPNSFLVDEGKLWCEPCFTASHGHECSACNGAISPATPAVSVGDRKWHDKCFVCKACQKPLAGQEFFDHAAGIHCGACYTDTLASKCTKCKKQLGPEGGLTYSGHSYHPACFTCTGCSCQISTGEFVAREDELFCKSCYSGTMAPKCHSCGQPITSSSATSNYTSHDDKTWHNGCFVCCVCSTNLTDTGFVFKNKKPHCKSCVLK